MQSKSYYGLNTFDNGAVVLGNDRVRLEIVSRQRKHAKSHNYVSPGKLLKSPLLVA